MSQAKVSSIVDHLKKGELAATRCRGCSSVYFPPRMDCPKCQGEEFDWTQLSPNCKLVTFTEVFFAPPAFQKDTPYMLGLAELEDGHRVFAPVDRKIPREHLKPGALLVLRAKTREGEAYYELGMRENRSEES